MPIRVKSSEVFNHSCAEPQKNIPISNIKDIWRLIITSLIMRSPRPPKRHSKGSKSGFFSVQGYNWVFENLNCSLLTESSWLSSLFNNLLVLGVFDCRGFQLSRIYYPSADCSSLLKCFYIEFSSFLSTKLLF